MSIQAAQWFSTDIVDAPKKMNHANNWPFFMESGEECRFCILNPDDERIPPIHYHNVFVDGRVKRVLCTAAAHLGGDCPLCNFTAEQPEPERWKTKLNQDFAYTVLIDFYDKTKPPKKCLRLSMPSDHRILQQRRETAINKMDKDGIQYEWIELTRPKDDGKAPRIGKIGTMLGRLDTSKYDEDFLRPFTLEEILVQFVSDPQEMKEIYEQFPLGAKPSSKKAKIRDVN